MQPQQQRGVAKDLATALWCKHLEPSIENATMLAAAWGLYKSDKSGQAFDITRAARGEDRSAAWGRLVSIS